MRMRRPSAALAALLVVTAAASFSQDEGAGRAQIREGNAHYDKGNFPDAEVSYRKALGAEGDGVAAKFNLGDALYRQDRFDEAAGQYEGAAASAKDKSVRAQAYHNLGNALLKGRKIEESIESYKQALRLDPSDDDTRYNLEYAKQLLQQQQQQQQQQKQDKNDDKQKEQEKKKDEQKKDEQQNQDKQDQRQNQKDRPQPRQPKDQISKADAERILEALKQQEQDVKKKLQKKVPARVKVEKDW